MRRFMTSKTALLAAVLAAAAAGFGAMAAGVYAAGTQTRNLGAAVFACAAAARRMPASIEEMVQAGYARPGGRPGDYLLLAEPNGSPLGGEVTVSRFEIAWGVRPEQLLERDKGVFWRDRPQERVLLVRMTDPPRVVEVLGGRMAMAMPVELYRELSGTAADAAGVQRP